MTVEFVAFAVGAFLLAVAALGGGIEVKEVRVPPLKPLPRILATILGLALVLGPTGLGESVLATARPKAAKENPQPPEPKPTAPATQPEPVAPPEPGAEPQSQPQPLADLRTEVVLEDGLGDHQKYERINVFINGEHVGMVSIDELQPVQSLRFKVNPGDTYRLTGTEASIRDGRLTPLTVRGSGIFRSPVANRYSLSQVAHDDTTVTIELRR